jgi:hypothetical protein
MNLPYTNIPADGQQIPSGEYQGLPEPPGAEEMQQPQPDMPPLGGVDLNMAMRWAGQYLMPHLFGSLEGQDEQQRPY